MKQYPNILLVDDDMEDCMIIKDAFEDSGHTFLIHFEQDGEKAIGYLQQCLSARTLPSLIILDLNMPRMNGRQTLTFLKNDPALAAIPVIIFSTSLNQFEYDQCLALGAHSYVIKPMTYKEAQEVVAYFYKTATELSTGAARSI
jgi:CheY-like chemotaxis protein